MSRFQVSTDKKHAIGEEPVHKLSVTYDNMSAPFIYQVVNSSVLFLSKDNYKHLIGSLFPIQSRSLGGNWITSTVPLFLKVSNFLSFLTTIPREEHIFHFPKYVAKANWKVDDCNR